MPEDVQVKVGQLWADNDPRCAGRRLRIVRIVGEHAEVYSWYENKAGQEGRSTRVALSRFKPTRTGYRLISEPPRA